MGRGVEKTCFSFFPCKDILKHMNQCKPITRVGSVTYIFPKYLKGIHITMNTTMPGLAIELHEIHAHWSFDFFEVLQISACLWGQCSSHCHSSCSVCYMLLSHLTTHRPYPETHYQRLQSR